VSLLYFAGIAYFIYWRTLDFPEYTLDYMIRTEGDYTVLGNLIPEIAGIAVVGKFILSIIVRPAAKISFYSSVIPLMFQSRTREVEDRTRLCCGWKKRRTKRAKITEVNEPKEEIEMGSTSPSKGGESSRAFLPTAGEMYTPGVGGKAS